MPSKLRWGILGTGNIANQFTIGLKTSARGELAAVGSRRREMADAFARTHEIPRAHANYEALIADANVDAGRSSV